MKLPFHTRQCARRAFSLFASIAVTSILMMSCSQGGGSSNGSAANGQLASNSSDLAPETNTADKARTEQMGYNYPAYSDTDVSQILTQYGNLDPGHVVPTDLLEKAVLYYNANRDKLGNKNYISVINYGKYSSEKRFFIINMSSGQVASYYVAHGKGSDENNDGLPEKFSNEPNSDATSVGVMVTGEVYTGEHGISLRLDGLSATNSNVRDRDVVVHAADYVQDAPVKQGRSWGCPAVPPQFRDQIIAMIKGGSIVVAGVSH